jgi:MFS family permease
VPDQTAVDTVASEVSGITAVIAGNFFVAAAQPFLSNFVTAVAEEYMPAAMKGLFIGAASTCSSLGYDIGYLVSIYAIGSPAAYAARFGEMNAVYIVVVLLASAVTAWSVWTPTPRHSHHHGAWEAREPTEFRRKMTIGVVVLAYAFTGGASTVISNYQGGILVARHFTPDAIFWMSCVSMMCAIPFGVLTGWLLDGRACAATVFLMSILTRAIGNLVFETGTTAASAYAGLILAAVAKACVNPAALVLISRASNGESARNWNNAMLSASNALTLAAMLAPLHVDNLSALFVASGVTQAAFVVLTWFHVFRRRALFLHPPSPQFTPPTVASSP